MNKLKRYHISIYVPDWAGEAVNTFCKEVSQKKITYSYHATRKLKRMKAKHRRAVKQLVEQLDISNPSYIDYVFEFYTNICNSVRKICLRIPRQDLDTDIILVLSSSGKVVTIYLNDNFDNHNTLNEDLYEKGEVIDVQAPAPIVVTY